MQIKRMMLNTVLFFAIPGPKMIWQFGEFGYDLELNNDRLGVKPTRWEYLENSNRRDLFLVYQAMIYLKTKTDYLDDEYFSWQSDGDVKWIKYDHPQMNIVIYGNTSKESQETTRYLTKPGIWYDYMTGQSIEVNDTNETITLAPGSYGIYSDQPIDNSFERMSENFLTSIASQPMESLIFYPNPSTDRIIFTGGVVAGTAYRIYNLSGRIIQQGLIKDNIVNIAHLPIGTFIVQVKSRDQLFIHKLIKN
jgi:hypothetical protein